MVMPARRGLNDQTLNCRYSR